MIGWTPIGFPPKLIPKAFFERSRRPIAAHLGALSFNFKSCALPMPHETHDPNDDQVDRDDEVQKFRPDEDENAGGEGDDGGQVQVHSIQSSPRLRRAPWGETLPRPGSPPGRPPGPHRRTRPRTRGSGRVSPPLIASTMRRPSPCAVAVVDSHRSYASSPRRSGATTRMTESTLGEFPQRYLAALGTHCGQAPHARDMEAAPLLGMQALSLGIDTLELAAIHDQALSTLKSDGTPPEFSGRTKLAEAFFASALLPIEASHRTGAVGRSHLEQLSADLATITRDLDDATRDLEREIAARKSAEQALLTSEERSAKLRTESQKLYSRVQELAHKAMGANEGERRALSLLLQNQVAQALLGIHLRLLAMRGRVTANSKSLGKDVEVTRRLIRKTVKEINRIIREFGIAHES